MCVDLVRLRKELEAVYFKETSDITNGSFEFLQYPTALVSGALYVNFMLSFAADSESCVRTDEVMKKAIKILDDSIAEMKEARMVFVANLTPDNE